MPYGGPREAPGPVCLLDKGSAADCWSLWWRRSAARRKLVQASSADPLSAVDLKRRAAAGPEPPLVSCGMLAPAPVLEQRSPGETKRGDATCVTSVNERFG